MYSKTSTLMFNLILLTFILLSYTDVVSQHGVSTEWGSEIILPRENSAHSQRGVLFNNMVSSGTGRIFVLTVEIDMSVNPPNGLISGIYIYYSDNQGLSWSDEVLFTPVQLVVGASPPKIAITNDNFVHFVWSSKIPAALFYSKYDHNLHLITDTIRIANKVNYDSFTPHLTTDYNDRLHVMWHEGNPDTTLISEVYYSRSTNSGNNWMSPVPLSYNDGKHSAFPRVQLDAASGDTIAIAWRDQVYQSNWDIQMAISTNGGLNWSNPDTINPGNNYDSDPDVVIDNQNRIHLFFHQYPVGNPFWGANIRYSYSDNLGVNWYHNTYDQISETGFRSHLVEGSRYDAVNNILWTFWKDERDFYNGQERGDMVCIFSTNRGESWTPPEFVTDRDSFPIGYKAACLTSDGSVAVNYEVSDTIMGLGIRTVYFRKRQSPIGINTIGNDVPQDFILFQNYPNPFNPVTKIKFDIPAEGKGNTVNVKLIIYDVLGRELTTLVNEQLNPGVYEVNFDGRNYPSGVYFYQLYTGSFTETKKMILLK